MSQYLEFEQPISELTNAINGYLAYCQKKQLDTGIAMDLLNTRLPQYTQHLYSHLSAWEKVQLARHPDRPYPFDLARSIFPDFLELHGDRLYADDQAVCGGFARLDGRSVMLIMSRKGRNLKENIQFNFGSAHPEGYRKALRLMKLANKAGCPIICLVDTAGAYPGIGAEERHIGEAIAQCLQDVFAFKVPIISVITGEGGSGGALALAVANRLLIMENAYFSVITPEGCSAILWRSEAEVARAAQALKLTSNDLLQLGVADQIVPEPLGGAQKDWKTAAILLKTALLEQLRQLEGMSQIQLQNQRYNKYRHIGQFTENANEHAVTYHQPSVDEIPAIHQFLQTFVGKKLILERTPESIKENLKNFILAYDDNNEIIGTIALRDFENGLSEIRTLTVDEKHEGQGVGSQLIQHALVLARKRHVKRVFTLTMKPKLFEYNGFTQVSIMRFPDKVQHDCESCTKRFSCDEVALLIQL